jgi:DNA ligase-1
MNSYQLPILYHVSKTGKISEWEILAEYLNDVPHVTTIYGYQDGAKQTTSVRVESGKNIGKSNETTAWEQACLIAKSKWEKQKLGNYRESLEEETKLLPMLAHKYQDHKNKVIFPCYVQKKLNGVRVLALVKENGVEYWSRKGKEYETLDHWNEELIDTFPVGTILDGEAFNPNLGLQEIVRRVKRVKTSRHDIKHDPLQYWIYDVVQTDKAFATRYTFLQWHFQYRHYQKGFKYLKLCDTFLIQNEKELEKTHKHNMRDGFEGTMIRSSSGVYRPDYRSYDLLKYKDFTDEEFKIIGGVSAQGKDEGTVVFECEVSPGVTFSVRPKGSFTQRKEYLDNLNNYIGKMLTVRYREKSEDGKPVPPVGICVRDYE